MHYDDPAFWRAGAISTIVVMSVVLIMLTIDSLAAISPGGSHVPPYTVINQHVDDLPPEKWTPGYAYFASACCGVMYPMAEWMRRRL